MRQQTASSFLEVLKNFISGNYGIIFLCMLLKIILHLPAIENYGFFGDELYFLICGQNLDVSFVDHGPFTPFIGWLTGNLFGNSLWGIRILSVISGALTILVAGKIVIELEGGKKAVLTASLLTALIPAYFRLHNMLHIGSFETLFWTLIFYFILRLIKTENPKLWLLIGFLSGITILIKPSFILVIGGLIIGFLVTDKRKLLGSPCFLIAALIAGAMGLPFFLWQLSRGFPMLEFMDQIMNRDPFEFFIGQIIYIGPLNIFIWIPGIIYCLKDKKGLKIFSVAYIFVFLYLIINAGKPYYISALYPFFLAAGAVFLEKKIFSQKRFFIPAISLLTAICFLFMPLGLPVLPIEQVESYAKQITLNLMPDAYQLYEDFYDMLNWDILAKDIKGVYGTLPEEEQKNTLIMTHHYGSASALRFLRKKYNLPPIISGHMTFYHWSQAEDLDKNILTLNIRSLTLKKVYNTIIHKGFIKKSNWFEARKLTTLKGVSISPEEVEILIEDYILPLVDKQAFRDNLIPTDEKRYTFKENLSQAQKTELLDLMNFCLSHYPIYLCKKSEGFLRENWKLFKDFGFLREKPDIKY